MDDDADFNVPVDIFAIGFEEIVDLNAGNIVSARFAVRLTVVLLSWIKDRVQVRCLSQCEFVGFQVQSWAMWHKDVLAVFFNPPVCKPIISFMTGHQITDV